MMKNSPSRIAKRRQGALVRRQANVKTWQTKFVGDALADANKAVLAKIKTAETDIANLEKKGVRV